MQTVRLVAQSLLMQTVQKHLFVMDVLDNQELREQQVQPVRQALLEPVVAVVETEHDLVSVHSESVHVMTT